MILNLKQSYKGKKVLVTGHTGFKGSWLCEVLKYLGADITGYSLDPPTSPNLFTICKIDTKIKSTTGDIRDLNKLINVVKETRPEIIIHMAAQPLVSVGYSDPVLTYSSNVMGTVNILEAARNCDSVKSILNVTTDKVYRNNEWEWGYRENEYLDGYDPYSNSKSCSELVSSSYRKCFFKNGIALSTARAGNVIGGGDFTEPRIIPDCVRSVLKNEVMILRNPHSIRPYQHVLEPIFAYLMIASRQMEDPSLSGSYNVGPSLKDCVDNNTLIKLFSKYWGPDFQYTIQNNPNEPHEANYLKLDCSKIKMIFGWEPIWSISDAIEKTIEWTKAYINSDPKSCMKSQITEYYKKIAW